MYFLPILCAYFSLWSAEARRKYWIPWKWRHRQLQAIMWVLQIEPVFSYLSPAICTSCILNHFPSSTFFHLFLFLFFFSFFSLSLETEFSVPGSSWTQEICPPLPPAITSQYSELNLGLNTSTLPLSYMPKPCFTDLRQHPMELKRTSNLDWSDDPTHPFQKQNLNSNWTLYIEVHKSLCLKQRCMASNILSLIL